MRSPAVRAIYLLFARVGVRGAQVVAFLLLARALSPEYFGYYGVITSAILVAVQVGNMGLRQAAGVLIGRGLVPEGEVLATLLVAWVGVSGVSAVGLTIWLWVDPSFGQTMPVSRAVVLAAISSGLLLTTLQGIYLGRGDLRAFGVADLGPSVILAISVALLYIIKLLSISTALGSLVVSSTLCAAAALVHLVSRIGVIKLNLSAVGIIARKSWPYAFPVALVFLFPRIGIFILSGIAPEEAIGHFFAAQRLSEIFLEIATAAGLVLFSDAARVRDTMASAKQTGRMVLILSLLFTAFAFIVSIFAAPVVRIALGPPYEPASGMVMLTTWILVPAAAVRLINGLFNGIARPQLSVIGLSLGALTNVSVTLIFVKKFGVYAAIYGLAGGYAVTLLLYVLIIKWCLAVNLTAFIGLDDLVARLRMRSVTKKQSEFK